MSNTCENKLKLSCPPDSPFANCVRTEVVIPEFSTLQNSCNSVQEVEEDMYTLIGEIKEEIDMSEVTSTCYTLPIEKTVKSLIEAILARLCAQQQEIEDLTTQVATQAEEILALQENNCP